MALPKSALLLIGQKLQDKGMGNKEQVDEESPEDSYGRSEKGDDAHMEHLEQAAADLIKSIQDGDPKAVAECFHEMFQCCEDMPHSEAGEEY